jgi:hypothetical protein
MGWDAACLKQRDCVCQGKKSYIYEKEYARYAQSNKMVGATSMDSNDSIPWLGVRSMARRLISERDAARAQLERIAQMGHGLVAEVKASRTQMAKLGILPVVELEARRAKLQSEVGDLEVEIARKRSEAAAVTQEANRQLSAARKAIVETDETALLQEVGIYKYRHPLTDSVAYEKRLEIIEADIKAMTAKDGGAILASTDWTVNGSASEGRAMIRDFSKLMLRAFNAEADNLVRGLKPYKLDAAIERLTKVADTIARLGQRMNISISRAYLHLRTQELALTADFLQKQAEEKEAERREREKMREERKVQQEIERERARLEKERQHYANAREALVAKGDTAGIERIESQLQEIEHNLKSVDFREANIRAGYVYVISNIGSFGEKVIKIGMTRRLDPMERIRELSDASVPFNFDVHAVHFSNDAVSIESAMHDRLANQRINTVNQRREFFRATPLEAKKHLADLAGELLQYTEIPEALEYRQSMQALKQRLIQAVAAE